MTKVSASAWLLAVRTEAGWLVISTIKNKPIRREREIVRIKLSPFFFDTIGFLLTIVGLDEKRMLKQ
jgi:hypothetical protein